MYKLGIKLNLTLSWKSRMLTTECFWRDSPSSLVADTSTVQITRNQQISDYTVPHSQFWPLIGTRKAFLSIADYNHTTILIAIFRTPQRGASVMADTRSHIRMGKYQAVQCIHPNCSTGKSRQVTWDLGALLSINAMYFGEHRCFGGTYTSIFKG
jgi:hypothetical protein